MTELPRGKGEKGHVVTDREKHVNDGRGE